MDPFFTFVINIIKILILSFCVEYASNNVP
jgi:hypothetical protein